MEKAFFFVNGIANDEKSKKLMRRHVMRGKNAGKKIHRRSRLDLQVTQNQPNVSDGSSRNCAEGNQFDHAKYANWSYLSPDRLSIQFGTTFLTFSLPVEITPYSLEIINKFFMYTADRIYPVKLGVSLHDAKFMWLRYLFESEATYQCQLAMMQASNEIFHCNGESSTKAMYHLSQTFAQVNKRLQGDDALSDSTIAIVMTLVNQEQIRQHLSAAMVHVKGLEKMIELRGGLSQLEGNVPLVLKICKTDIIFALQQGGSTSFFRDHIYDVRKSLRAQDLPFDQDPNVRPSPLENIDPYLQDILSDAMSVCSLFNEIGSKSFNYIVFLEVLISLCCRLLKFRSLHDANTLLDSQSAHHIGLITFMMTLFLQNDRCRLINYSLVPVCLKSALRDDLYEQNIELSFWLTVIGGIWISDEPENEWIASKLKMGAQRLGLTCWEDAQEIVYKYPWINGLHDQPGRIIWERANQIH
ncbi:uncharacterized protein N7503_003525 [Penicillium pulvis]|uniref:uncharacterized protein n=1 Tax=Penicillium pulvis TaxID=1562058 RepID=UPI0025476ECD|nr:uncharacterized protein N7503_003525 [Penicillium pulvis]KAJ5805923.1 hypothetical protein N7503_003525 [Penicillium pulvis]